LEKEKNNTSDNSEPKRIRIFSSFEEAEASEIANTLKQTGEERLAEVTQLIKKIYNYKPEKYYRIYFDKV
jgi:hypothetical protein